MSIVEDDGTAHLESMKYVGTMKFVYSLSTVGNYECMRYKSQPYQDDKSSLLNFPYIVQKDVSSVCYR